MAAEELRVAFEELSASQGRFVTKATILVDALEAEVEALRAEVRGAAEPALASDVVSPRR
jgi:hypothetical protein